jgi:thiol-disulfide isomerase/thioredoxin
MNLIYLKFKFTILFFPSLILLLACNRVENIQTKANPRSIPKQNSSKSEENPTQEVGVGVSFVRNNNAELNKTFNVDRKAILSDFMKWYTYNYSNIRLGQSFIGLNSDSVKINKAEFLKYLATGDFVPFKIMLIDNVPVYQLCKFRHNSQKIKNIISQIANTEIRYSEMEGKFMPEYIFTDLNGNTLTKADTKGMFMIVKCWFIRCTSCVAEMPELNTLVDQYKNREDVLFISLASDTKEELEVFLKKRKFSYRVVPGMDKYIKDYLKINTYPTHLVVNKNGKIIKVTSSVEDLKPFLKEHLVAAN